MKILAALAVSLLVPFQAGAQPYGMPYPGMPMPSATSSYQGLWWNAPAGSESGWGLNITHQGNILFATWFTYDADGNGMWLVMPRGELDMATNPYMPMDPSMDPYGMDTTPIYSGTLYRTTGPAFDAPSFSSAAVTATAVGSAMLAFMDSDNGQFTYQVNGVLQTKQITRQVFSTMSTCLLAGTAGPSPNYQALWWKAPSGSESGWGVNVTHQGDILFATWFTYDSSGRGLWLAMPRGEKTGATTYAGPLYRTTGPAFNASPWNPARVTATAVGSATFSFNDDNNGTFTATVNGVTQAKPITRQVYSNPTSVCRG